MLNIIKMDLYKMIKMKSFYVVTIIAMAFGIIMAMNLMPETSDTNTSSNKTVVESTDKNSASDSEDNSEVKIGVQIDTTGIKNTTPNAVYVYGTSAFDVSPDVFWHRGDSEPEIGNRGTV